MFPRLAAGERLPDELVVVAPPTAPDANAPSPLISAVVFDSEPG
jgi:hypothetical protein